MGKTMKKHIKKFLSKKMKKGVDKIGEKCYYTTRDGAMKPVTQMGL